MSKLSNYIQTFFHIQKQSKKAFTLIEIVIVLIIIGVLLMIIPYGLKWTENHVKLALVSQQVEDNWNSTLLRMRQGRVFDTATLSLWSTGWTIVYSWWIQQERTDYIVFENEVEVEPTQPLIWKMSSYAIACEWPSDRFILRYQGMKACYKVDTDSCTLKYVYYCKEE